MIQYTCPVCAYSLMPYPADEGNICPCCGTEFGYDDTNGVTFKDLRDSWVRNHAIWFSPVHAAPPRWNGIVQLILADYEFAPADWMQLASSKQTSAKIQGSPTNLSVSFSAPASAAA